MSAYEPFGRLRGLWCRLTQAAPELHMPSVVKHTIRQARAFASGFGDGLANAVSITGAPRRPFPAIERDPNRAFAKDWEKLGGDMRRAVDTVAGGKKP